MVKEDPVERHRPRRRLLALATLIVALALPAAALAWASTYVSGTYFSPGGIGLSDFNSGINYNEMSWEPPYDPGGQAGPHYGQVTLCDASYSCYDYAYSTSGFKSDTRSISYGRAKCNARSSNVYSIYVYDCYTHN